MKDKLKEQRKFFEASLINWKHEMKKTKEVPVETEEDEFYIKHRPTMFKQVKGQREAVNTLKGLLKKKSGLPHGLLFTGPSGCGKTTFSYILKNKIGCDDVDFYEYDAADFRGIDTIREIRIKRKLSPMVAGGKKIYLLDECHQLTSDAQNAMLKLLEDNRYKHVYYMLCTTDPNKLKTTIKTRCTEIKVDPLAKGDMEDVIAEVTDKEKLDISERVVAKICEVAEGSARKALVLLNQIAEIESESKQLKAVLSNDIKIEAIEIARALINGQPWAKVSSVLKGVTAEPEQLRHLILSFATSCLLGHNKRVFPRASLMVEWFGDNFYDSKRAGLVRACYEVAQIRNSRR